MFVATLSTLLLGSLGLAAAADDIGIEGKDWHWATPLELPKHELVKRGQWNTSAALAEDGFGMISPFLYPASEPLELSMGRDVSLFGRLSRSLEARKFVCYDEGYGKCPQRDECAPLDAQCCDDFRGHCLAGTYCMKGVRGCCDNGKVCSGVAGGGGGGSGSGTCKTKGWERCSNGEEGCAPPGADCCTDRRQYCDPGEECYNSWCCPKGKRPCHRCETSNKDECNGRCMPRGAVCCASGGYCDPGETCTGDGRCQYGSGGGGGGGGGGGAAAGAFTTKKSSTSEWQEPSSTSEWQEPSSTSEWQEPSSTSEWQGPSSTSESEAPASATGAGTPETSSTSEWTPEATPTSTYVPIAGNNKSPTTTSVSFGPEATAKTVKSGGLSITSVDMDDVAWQGNWTRTWACSGNARVTNSQAAATVKLDADVQGYSMSWDLDTFTEIEIDNDGQKSRIKSSDSSYGKAKSGCTVNYVWTFDTPGVHQVYFRTFYFGEKRQSQVKATLNEIEIYQNKADVPKEGSPTPAASSSARAAGVGSPSGLLDGLDNVASASGAGISIGGNGAPKSGANRVSARGLLVMAVTFLAVCVF